MSIFRTPATYILADIVLIRACTNVHVGVGRSGGVVDLPIQRDELGFPSIYSSSIKGALKTSLLCAFMDKHRDFEKAKYAINAILGPDPEEGESFESSIAILDAYLLAIPVRSLKGIYAYVTSPILLKKFLERIDLCSKVNRRNRKQSDYGSNNILKKIQSTTEKLIKHAEYMGKNQALCIGECERIIIDQPESLKETILLAEEFLLRIQKKFYLKNKKEVEGSKDEADDEEKISSEDIKVLSDTLGLDRPLLVLHDDIARSIIDRSLLRLARIRLKRETKTVEAGPWTEEYVPIKTLFYTLFFYKRPPLTESFVKRILKVISKSDVGNIDDRVYLEVLEKLCILSEKDVKEMKNIKSSLDKEIRAVLVEKIRRNIWETINGTLQGFIIMGGKETIGKGIVELRLLVDWEDR